MKTLNPRTLLATAIIASSVTAPAMAQEAGDFLFRIGATYVAPNSDSGNLVFEGTALDGFQAEVQDQLGLGFNITYFLSSNWGVELLLATPFDHDIDGDQALTAATDRFMKQMKVTDWRDLAHEVTVDTVA